MNCVFILNPGLRFFKVVQVLDPKKTIKKARAGEASAAMAVLAVLRTVILGYYKTPLYLARDNICLDLPVKEP